MSGTSERGGLWFAVAIVVGLLALAAWFMVGGGTAPADGTATGAAITKPAADAAPGEAGFRAPEGAEATPLTPKPVPVETRPGALVIPGTEAAADGTAIVARGRVIWAGGAVPYESDVKLFDNEGFDMDIASTEEDGSFVLSSDAPLAAGWSFGTDPIQVLHNGTPAWLAPTLAADLPLHLLTDAPIERDLHVGFAPLLSGRVVNAATRQPIEGAEIYAASSLVAYGWDQPETETGPDGRYVLELEDLPLTGLLVWCVADDHQTVLAGPLDLAPAASPDHAVTQDFELGPALVARGVVMDARTREPIDGAYITSGSSFSMLTEHSDFEITDPDGTFALDVEMLPFLGSWLIINYPDYAPVALPLESATQFLEIGLHAPFTVAGLVVDEAGAPVPHASVEIAFDGDTPSLEQDVLDMADCDENGAFETVLELVPDDRAILRVDQLGKLPYRARLTDVGVLRSGNRWEVGITLRSE